jgi:Family of unknown function (DUF5675)
MKLTRTAYRSDGIFGRIYNDHGVPLAYTLEHAYQQEDGNFLPKVAEGTYNCILGSHELEGMTHPFQAYMLENVPPFMGLPVTNILIHMGNFDRDSNGCIVLGRTIATQMDGSLMVTNSVNTFEDFMNGLSGVSSFTLEVTHVLET